MLYLTVVCIEFLYIWENMQFNEIARLQEQKEATVKKRFYRSIEKLQKRMEEKHLRAIVPLPFLLTAIKQSGSGFSYAVPQGLLGEHVMNIITNNTSPINQLTTMKAFLTSKMGITLIAVTAGITTVGARKFTSL